MIFLLLLLLCSAAPKPEQVHLSIGRNPNTLVVMWTTFEPSQSSDLYLCMGEISGRCQYRTGTMRLYLFDDEEEIGEPGIPRYLHTAVTEKLNPGMVYSYKVGSQKEKVWSQMYRFRAFGNLTAESARLIAFGDLGTCSDLSKPTVAALTREGSSMNYDFFIHIGDFAYNLNTYNGRRGDEFLRDIEGFAARTAFMTVVGNHERYQNYTHYRNLFRMPGDTEGYYYSFDVGPVHAVVFSTETLCSLPSCPALHAAQLLWLQSDLAQAQLSQRPWILAFAHHPLYCSVDWNDPGEYENCVLEAGERRTIYEDLFAAHKVDMVIHGHMHNYERMGPVYKGSGWDSDFASSHLYVNPKAPLYVVTGAAGSCLEDDIAYSSSTPEPFSVFRTEELSYTRVFAENSYLKVEHLSAITGDVLDHFYVVKTE